MLKTKIMMAALALSLGTTGTALAKHYAPRAGFDANAQAIGGELHAIGPRLAMNAEHRASALHQCNKKAGKFKNYTYGARQLERYRACMAKHGQPG